MSLRLGILGYPLGHSLSPVFQQAALDHLGIDAMYEPWPVPSDQLEEKVNGLRSPDVLGANVTVPYKEAVIPLVDSLDSWARIVGAVNTIVKQDGKLRGYNTDSHGFVQGLREVSFDPSGAKVLLLGAGGGARGVALALARLKISSLAIANRTLQRAQRLAEELQRDVENVTALPLETETLREVALTSDLIVNSTSLGTRHTSYEDATSLTTDCMPATTVVYDLVYNPTNTPFLQEAARAGARTVNGLTMLVHQGAASFALWTNRDAPVEVMMEAARAALESAR